MQFVTLTFTRIFDVQKKSASRYTQQLIEFSFDSNITQQFGVSVPGWPEFEVGDTVTCALKEANNWQTLQGWINHRTNEIVTVNVSGLVASTLTATIVSIWCLIVMHDEFKTIIWPAKIIFFSFPIFTLWGIARITQTVRLKNQLKALVR